MLNLVFYVVGQFLMWLFFKQIYFQICASDFFVCQICLLFDDIAFVLFKDSGLKIYTNLFYKNFVCLLLLSYRV